MRFNRCTNKNVTCIKMIRFLLCVGIIENTFALSACEPIQSFPRSQMSPRTRFEKHCSRAGVPNLGYMYPGEYICLSEGVHLRLAIEGKNIFTCCLFSNLYAGIT